MVIRVFKIGEVNDGAVRPEAKAGPFKGGDLAAFLTNQEYSSNSIPAPNWTMSLIIGEDRRKISIDLAPLFSNDEFELSHLKPHRLSMPMTDREVDVFFFKNRFFFTEREIVSNQDYEEVILRIKKITYDEETELVALRSAVANIEAAIDFQRSGPRREPISDDVKLVVWSRDGGACVRCGSKEKMHFDHIIPVVKGGGNGENNIQLLCEGCNLKKSDRIAF
jgi:hypothetical protein